MLTYGSHLFNVCIFSDIEMNSLAEICPPGGLSSLELLSINFDEEMISRSRAMLSQLKSLDVGESRISDQNLGRLLAICPQLESLHLSATGESMSPLLSITSKNMKTIEW